jgi:hypothetical protein
MDTAKPKNPLVLALALLPCACGSSASSDAGADAADTTSTAASTAMDSLDDGATITSGSEDEAGGDDDAPQEPDVPPDDTGPEPNDILMEIPPNGCLDLGAYVCTEMGAGAPDYCGHIFDYSGMIYDPDGHRVLAFGGGHASTNYDSVNAFSLATLTWIEDYPPTLGSEMTVENYDYGLGAWLSGTNDGPYPRAAARHTEDLMLVADGALWLLTPVEGNGMSAVGDSPYTSYGFATTGKIARYDLIDRSWSFTATEPLFNWPGTAVDPISGVFVGLGTDGLYVYDPVADTKAMHIDLRTYEGLEHLVDEQGVQVDNDLGYNSNLVYFPPNDSFYYHSRGGGHMYRLGFDRDDPAASMITRQSATGPVPNGSETGLVYDAANEVIGQGPIDNAFFVFDPATKTWASSIMDGCAPGTVDFHALEFDPVDGVYIFAAPVGPNPRIYAYRWG